SSLLAGLLFVYLCVVVVFFFFQAEDGIRDATVTGVQTCALPILATAVVAIFGLLALRATGVYFLMITLALGMVVWGLAHRWVSMTQGDNGISSVPRPDLGLPWSFTRGIPFYYLAFAGFLLALALLRTIVRSPFGQTLVGIRESESRMRTLGYHVWLHKYIGFVIAGGVGGFAGVLWAYYNVCVS